MGVSHAGQKRTKQKDYSQRSGLPSFLLLGCFSIIYIIYIYYFLFSSPPVIPVRRLIYQLNKDASSLAESRPSSFIINILILILILIYRTVQ